jgi:hypothetical protein
LLAPHRDLIATDNVKTDDCRSRVLTGAVTDYKGTGEISPKGSISWSDFKAVKKATVELKPQALLALPPFQQTRDMSHPC